MRIKRFLIAAVALVAVVGCQAPVAPEPEPEPAPVVPPPPTRSAESLELEEYYAGVQAGLLVQGLLRTDGGGPDTPFTATQLADNFRQIAFFEEYSTVSGRLLQRETASRLHRWEEPVRIMAEFGDLVPPEMVEKDTADLAAYAARLARLTGHPVEAVPSGANFHVLFLFEEERRAIGPRLRQLIPGISDTAVETVTDLPRSSYCLVLALDPGNTGVYTRAVAVIRAEHPDLFRLSCIHEEVAQGLGLSNDSPRARPSIFNDDEEFALLTTQDELMLGMLYDARLTPGMGLSEANPIIPELAAERMGLEVDVVTN